MKKRASRLLSIILALCLALALLPGTALAAGGPENSNNRHTGMYEKWASTVSSYLYENEDGELTRVEFIRKYGSPSYIAVERYDSSFHFLSGQTIPMELSIWGGFFAGENYNFLIFGQNNTEEDNNKEVIRVVKYSKDWQRLEEANVYGANTVTPFDAGSLRCAEYGGVLYIRTSHKMYKIGGVNHQANMTIAVRESDMTVTDSAHSVVESGACYVSHSFNQFIMVDREQRIVALDHGDGFPRAAVLSVFPSKAGAENVTRGSAKTAAIQRFPGGIGENSTGASLGGLAETASGYVVAYSYDGDSRKAADGRAYFAYIDKDSLRVESKEIFNPGDSASPSTPVLVPTGLDGGYILWNDWRPKWEGWAWDYNDLLYYAAYSGDGSVGEVKTATAALSDCQPIVYNGKVVWYSTNYTGFTNNKNLTFYQLDENGVTAVQVLADGTPISSPVSVTVNGVSVPWTDAVPFIDENGRTMVPLRAAADVMGFDVSWDAAAREAVFTDGEKTIYFPIGSSTARTSGGGMIRMDTAAVIVNDRTYAPIRYLAEYFGYYKVDWDAARQTVVITVIMTYVDW